MRADGKGWGQIAHALGFKLGDVVRSEAGWREVPGEGGHAGFAPATQRQADLWQV